MLVANNCKQNLIQRQTLTLKIWSQEKIKFLFMGLNLNRSASPLHWAQQNILKEIKGVLNKWKNRKHSWIVKLNAIKISFDVWIN